jgi:DNA-binding transcriptional regulator LsrR (DeoR family)
MSLTSKESKKLDDAARAGWLYYVAGKTQDEIAQNLNVSRQSAQRMVALSVSEGLIKVRLEHPVARCMDLSTALKQKFGLSECIVVPSTEGDKSSSVGLAQAGAAEIERHLKSSDPIVLACGTGRSLKACVDELGHFSCEQHKIVALLGNIANDGSASDYNVVVQMAQRVNAKHYPMPLPVLPKSKTEKEHLHSLELVSRNLKLAERADVTFVGVGNVGENSPLVNDGFIDVDEAKNLNKLGAVGELIGWVYNIKGELLDCELNARVASARLSVDDGSLIYCIAAGQEKTMAIYGALKSSLMNALITNEYTAEKLLEMN